MDFEKLVKFRRSSRWLFIDKEIPNSDIKKILDAARFAPTPHNSQPFEIIVIKDKDVIKDISEVGFRLDKKGVEGHFYWTRFTSEEHQSKKDGVQIEVLPKFVLDLKDDPKLIDDDYYWKKAMKLYSFLIQNCSHLLFVLYNKKMPGVGPLHHLWGIISIGAVIQNLWLAANNLGISVHLVSGQLMNPDSVKQLSKILSIPSGYKIMSILRLGYESGSFGKYGTRIRKELSDFVHLNKFSNKFRLFIVTFARQKYINDYVSG
ncbi:MAG: nitroreductase family protein [Promethearchaeota archaeon]|nr:MAG: nitroreductase family protein [Candidatus Lokiarchaeota archaeon]